MAKPTPEDWLARLTTAIEQRRTRTDPLRARLGSDGPLPEGAEGLREAYRAFQKRARTNFAELVTGAVAERMRVANFTVDAGAGDHDTARAVFKRSRGPLVTADTLWDMLGLGVGYQLVTGPPGRAVITYERPEQAITEPSPTNPVEAIAGLKVWTDPHAGLDRATLWLAADEPGDPGRVYLWDRPTPSQSFRIPLAGSLLTGFGVWTPRAVADGPPFVPLVPFDNRDSAGEFERHTDILNRIDYVVLQRLVIIALQAYRQRATKGELAEKDEAGNVIDYADLFRPGPGALWHLPPGVELWESQQTSIADILNAAKDDIRELSAVTRTPLASLLPDGGNQSAEGATFAREGLIFKTADRIDRASAAAERVMAYALAIESDTLDNPPDVEVKFAPPERLSLAERADAASKAANDIPWRSRIIDLWGYSGDDADRMDLERQQDALVAGLAAPSILPGVTAPAADAQELTAAAV